MSPNYPVFYNLQVDRRFDHKPMIRRNLHAFLGVNQAALECTGMCRDSRQKSRHLSSGL